MEMMNHRVVWIGRGPKDHLGLTRRKPVIQRDRSKQLSHTPALNLDMQSSDSSVPIRVVESTWVVNNLFPKMLKLQWEQL